MNIKLFEGLHADGHINGEELKKIKYHQLTAPVSVRRELLILLYFGILILTTGLGLLIYDNIDTIGHLTIVLLIAALTAGCFFYCFKKANKPSWQKIESPNVWFDYILFLGCLLSIIFIGYLQFQYTAFGTRWGLATFIPFVLLAFSAYYFDHLGVLSLAITNFAAWIGISVNFMQINRMEMFSSEELIYKGLVLGGFLLLLATISINRGIKVHFSFTYRNFGVHILFISLLAGMFTFEKMYLLWFLGMLAFSAFMFFSAKKNASFYFILITVLYFYVALSYVVIRILLDGSIQEGAIYLTIMYFIASGIGLILFLMNLNKTIKQHDSVQ